MNFKTGRHQVSEAAGANNCTGRGCSSISRREFLSLMAMASIASMMSPSLTWAVENMGKKISSPSKVGLSGILRGGKRKSCCRSDSAGSRIHYGLFLAFQR